MTKKLVGEMRVFLHDVLAMFITPRIQRKLPAGKTRVVSTKVVGSVDKKRWVELDSLKCVATAFGRDTDDVDAALRALESDGAVLHLVRNHTLADDEYHVFTENLYTLIVQEDVDAIFAYVQAKRDDVRTRDCIGKLIGDDGFAHHYGTSIGSVAVAIGLGSIKRDELKRLIALSYKRHSLVMGAEQSLRSRDIDPRVLTDEIIRKIERRA